MMIYFEIISYNNIEMDYIIKEMINNKKIQNIIYKKFGKDCGNIILNYKKRMDILEKIDECFILKNTKKVYHLKISFNDFKEYCMRKKYSILIEFIIQVNYTLSYFIIPLCDTEFNSKTINIRWIHINNEDDYMKLEFYIGFFRIKYPKIELFKKIPTNIFDVYIKYHGD